MAGDRTVKVTLKGDVNDFTRALVAASAGTKAFSAELNSSTDRATNLTQSILAIGPALVPIAAAGVPIVAGLSNQLAFAAAGAGVAALAFSGVGEALKATNDYAIEPSIANFEKMQQSMSELGPAGRDFVTFLQELRPQLQGLQDAAQAGLFPGAEAGIRELMDLLPQAERIVSVVASSVGDLIAEAGDNLNDPRWREFFAFLENEARPTLINMGRTLGNFTEGFANLWMAFDPLSDRFSNSFLQMSRDFAAWTDGLSETEGFQDFIAYIAENGPRAWGALGAIGNALLQIVEAAAPVGSAALPVIEALSDAIAAVADSDLGPIIVGVVALTSALSRMKALGTVMNTSAMGGLFGKSAYAGTLSSVKQLPGAILQYDGAAARAQASVGQLAVNTGKLGASLRGTAKLAGGVGGMAFVMSDLDDKMGLTNTATLGLAGSMAGPWGAAVGAGIGLALDLAAAEDQVEAAMRRADEATKSSALSIHQQIEAQNAALAAIARRKAELEARDAASAAAANGRGDRFAAPSGRNDSAIDDLNAKSKEVTATIRELERAEQDAAFAEAGLTEAMAGATQATRDQTMALLDNIAKHNERANALLGDRGAMRNIEAAIDDATRAAKENGKTLDINTSKGRSNQAALDAIASSYNTLSDGAKRNASTQKHVRAAIIAAAISMGKSSEAAEKLADDLMQIPSPKPKVEVKGWKEARAALAAVKAALDAINPFKRISVVTTNKTVYDHGQTKSANGNIFDFFANGGFSENHIAQIAPAGVTRVWNEPETQGESYIPLANDHRRPRALSIWAETGKRLGVEGFADGALLQRMNGGSGSQGGLAPATPAFDERALAALLEAGIERGAARAFNNAHFYLDAQTGTIRQRTMGA